MKNKNIPVPPKPPLIRKINESVGIGLGFCKNCGSSLKRDGFMSRKLVCINENCKNSK